MVEEIDYASIVILRALVISALVDRVSGWATLVVVSCYMGSVGGIVDASGRVARLHVLMYHSIPS
jgi:hypothetical protein